VYLLGWYSPGIKEMATSNVVNAIPNPGLAILATIAPRD